MSADVAPGIRRARSERSSPLADGEGGEEDTDPEEAGWRTAVDAAPWLVGDSDQTEEVPPEEMFEKLKPFKDRVAEDIREDSSRSGR